MGALGCYKADLIPTYIPHSLPDRWPDGEMASVKYTYFTDMKANVFGRHEMDGLNRPKAVQIVQSPALNAMKGDRVSFDTGNELSVGNLPRLYRGRCRIPR
jgi:hypothetical protein